MSKPTLFFLYPIWLLAAQLLFFPPVICLAYSSAPNLTIEQGLSPYVHLEKADSLQKIQSLEQALIHTQHAQSLHKEAKEWVEYIDCYLRLSSLYQEMGRVERYESCLRLAIVEGEDYLGANHPRLGDLYAAKSDLLFTKEKYNRAKYFIKKSISIFICESEWEKYLWGKYLLAATLFHTKDYAGMECNLTEALASLEILEEEEDRLEFEAHILQLLGVLYDSRGEYNRALEISKEALPIYEKRADSSAIATTCNNIGAIFFSKNDYEQAINYLDYSIDICKKISGEYSTDCAETYANIGLAYLAQKEFTTTLEYLYKSLEITKNKKNDNPAIKNTIDCYNNLSQTYFDLGKYDTSYHFAQKALSLNQDVKNALHITHHLLSSYLQKKGDYEEALKLSKSAATLSIDKFGERHPRVAMNYKELAKIYYSLNQIDTALFYCQKALIAVSLQFNSTNIEDNPPITEVNNEGTFYKILEIKGELLQLAFQRENKNIALLISALNTFKLAIQSIDRMRQSFEAEASKHTLAENALPIYEKSIEVAIELSKWFETHPNNSGKTPEDYLKDAFLFAEKNKATILLEAIKESKALRFADIPETVLEQEKSLKRDIGFYERNLFEEKQKTTESPDSLKMSFWKTQIFELKREYQKLSDTLEEKYPDYYGLKYNIEVATVEDLQKQLAEKGETLLEYFVGEKNVYVFVITSSDIKIHSIQNNDTLKKHFEALLKTLKISPSKTKNKEKAYLAYLYSAHWIYKNLVQKVLPPENTVEDIGQLIVIPDGIMGYIPFEVLLMKYPDNTNGIHFELDYLDYLIEKYSISYAYSSSLLLEGLKAVEESNWHKKENYAGFAPVFSEQNEGNSDRKKGSCSVSELETLEESENEVKELGKKMEGIVFLKEQATKKNFMTYGTNKHVLHLATHACLSEADPMSNTIHFVNDYLFTSELFNIKLDVDLAILSACNTGSGILSPGEGIMSLSRGFLYAGCPSIITSLWSVNDKAAADIVINLHDNLLEGQSKHDALRSAKLQYIESVPNRLRAPYYWGAFVHVGNPKAIEWDFSSGNFGWIFGLIFIFSGAVLYLLKKRIGLRLRL